MSAFWIAAYLNGNSNKESLCRSHLSLSSLCLERKRVVKKVYLYLKLLNSCRYWLISLTAVFLVSRVKRVVKSFKV